MTFLQKRPDMLGTSVSEARDMNPCAIAKIVMELQRWSCCTHTQTCTCVRPKNAWDTRIQVCVHIYVYVAYIHVCNICLCMYVYIHIYAHL